MKKLIFITLFCAVSELVQGQNFVYEALVKDAASVKQAMADHNYKFVGHLKGERESFCDTYLMGSSIYIGCYFNAKNECYSIMLTLSLKQSIDYLKFLNKNYVKEADSIWRDEKDTMRIFFKTENEEKSIYSITYFVPDLVSK